MIKNLNYHSPKNRVKQAASGVSMTKSSGFKSFNKNFWYSKSVSGSCGANSPFLEPSSPPEEFFENRGILVVLLEFGSSF